MIVGAHQPAFLPWLGYLDKLAKSDVFVVMDDLQYEAQNFQNRNRIKVNNGPMWLTVPLKKGHQQDRIIDKLVQNEGGAANDWQARMWQTIKIHYGKAPYFRAHAEALEGAFFQRWERLVDLDLYMLEVARTAFGITRPVLRSSTLELVGQKSERIIDMCRKLGASVYLSGKGGSTSYLDLTKFDDAGIRVMWQEFQHPQYEQRYPQLGFVPYLGFIDLLFNCGASALVGRRPSIAGGMI